MRWRRTDHFQQDSRRIKLIVNVVNFAWGCWFPGLTVTVRASLRTEAAAFRAQAPSTSKYTTNGRPMNGTLEPLISFNLFCLQIGILLVRLSAEKRA